MPPEIKRFARTVALLILLAGCAAQMPRALLPDADGIIRTFLMPAGRVPVSDTPQDAAEIARAVTLRPAAEIAARRSTEDIRLDQLAFMFRSPEGRAYMLATGPKALVRGEPAASCPVQVLAEAGGRGRAQDVVANALRFCHDDLAALGREDCGCAVLAHDQILHAPLADFEYAIDLPVRLFRAGRLDPVRYLASEALAEDGTRSLIVTAAGAEVLRVDWPDQGQDMRVTGALAGGTALTGTRQPLGFDRGRLVQSFTLRQADGAALRIVPAP